MYEELILPNGVRLLHEAVPSVRSAALGIWIGAGSRNETAAENGSCHFIEHMLFKGTKTRSAEQLARESDAIGGRLNAYTTKECTCFYGHVLDTHLPALTDILSDMLLHSLFRERDVKSERGVICDEIDMYADDPEDLVHEQLYLRAFAGSSLARPVLGTRKSLAGLRAADLKRTYARCYTGGNVLIALSGSYAAADLDRIADAFSALPSGPALPVRRASYRRCLVRTEKDCEQNQLVLAWPCISLSDPSRYAFSLLSAILGGGASSRLFQSVREKRGLCYTISAGGSCHRKEGLFVIHTGVSPEAERDALKLILRELDRLKQDGVTGQELDAAKEQPRANLLMGLESTVSRMNHLARGALYTGEILSPEELCARYDGVTREQVRELACRWLDNGLISLSAVGRPAPEAVYREVLGL